MVRKREERGRNFGNGEERGAVEIRDYGCGWLQNAFLAMGEEKRGRDHLDRVNGPLFSLLKTESARRTSKGGVSEGHKRDGNNEFGQEPESVTGKKAYAGAMGERDGECKASLNPDWNLGMTWLELEGDR